ncbi:hypothetical protein VTN00DRAFT_2905 [Thermoascus crustaceus]|uniref:uncharacterized protein n=1 Tax=Thermoascus crustaceus TaxID=5088 RepID=UPI0037423A00
MLSETPSTKPTIFIVPGAWHLPECFDALREVLESHGYPTESIAHPSIGAEPPTKTLDDDAKNVRKTLSRLIDKEGKDVILIGHSYGGNVVSNASDGFGRATRAAEGKAGGISLLIYLTGFVVPKGKSLLVGLGGQWQPWMKFDGEYSYASDEANIFYNDLSPEEQEKWVAKLRHGSKASYTTDITHEPWHHMRCAYVFCDEDHALPPFAQNLMVQTMKGEDGGEPEAGPILTARLPASHSPFLSMPHKTAETIEKLVAEVGN